ncbi:MAG TPA: carboxypeptidase-like regulatory domain-containing protein, partial [Phnomibacter sp.]|nr:carboxypeptidase-like regulatory domain-containing protein [Phnomibacter sp.]
MRKVLPSLAVLILVNLLTISAIAQSVTLKGSVKSAANQLGIPAVSVIIKGTSEGTYTDDNGEFSMTTKQALPFTLEITA